MTSSISECTRNCFHISLGWEDPEYDALIPP